MRRTKMVSAAKMLLQYYPNREWLPSQDKVKTLLNWIVVPNGASPRIEKIFKAFEMLEQSPRLVIVGQDPYPDDRATGVAFQTVKNVYSLAQKRIADSLGIQNGLYPDWDRWITEYRVLLINAALINTELLQIVENGGLKTAVFRFCSSASTCY